MSSTHSSNRRAAQSGNTDAENQTVQSGWGSEARRAFVTSSNSAWHRQKQSCSQPGRRPTILQSFRREALPKLWARGKEARRAKVEELLVSISTLGISAHSAAFLLREEKSAPAPQYPGLHEPRCKERLKPSKSCSHLEQQHWGGRLWSRMPTILHFQNGVAGLLHTPALILHTYR